MSSPYICDPYEERTRALSRRFTSFYLRVSNARSAGTEGTLSRVYASDPGVRQRITTMEQDYISLLERTLLPDKSKLSPEQAASIHVRLQGIYLPSWWTLRSLLHRPGAKDACSLELIDIRFVYPGIEPHSIPGPGGGIWSSTVYLSALRKLFVGGLKDPVLVKTFLAGLDMPMLECLALDMRHVRPQPSIANPNGPTQPNQDMDVGLQLVRDFPFLRAVRLIGSRVTDTFILRLLARCPVVERLELFSSARTTSALAAQLSLRNIGSNGSPVAFQHAPNLNAIAMYDSSGWTFDVFSAMVESRWEMGKGLKEAAFGNGCTSGLKFPHLPSWVKWINRGPKCPCCDMGCERYLAAYL